MKNKIRFIIGIDSGVNTGIAVREINSQKHPFLKVDSVKIHRAMELVLEYHHIGGAFLYVEDGRKIKNYHPGNANIKKYQGVGSVKRDAQIWEDFLTDHNIPHVMVKPISRNTKWNAGKFKRLTGWKHRTNEHSRDAGVLALHNPFLKGHPFILNR